MRAGRGQAARREQRLGPRHLRFDRRVVGEERAVHAPPLWRPRARRALERDAAYEDLVDPLDRRRVILDRVGGHVEVAAQDAPFGIRDEIRCEPDLDARNVGVVRRVQVRDGQRPSLERNVHRLANPPLAPSPQPLEPPDLRVQDEGPVAKNVEAVAQERRVRLPGCREPHPDWVDVRDEAGDRPQKAGHRDRPNGAHPAPALQPPQGPERNLLQRNNVGRVEADKAHHALQVGPARLGMRTPVIEVPGANDESHGRRSIGNPCADDSWISSSGRSPSSKPRTRVSSATPRLLWPPTTARPGTRRRSATATTSTSSRPAPTSSSSCATTSRPPSTRIRTRSTTRSSTGPSASGFPVSASSWTSALRFPLAFPR